MPSIVFLDVLNHGPHNISHNIKIGPIRDDTNNVALG